MKLAIKLLIVSSAALILAGCSSAPSQAPTPTPTPAPTQTSVNTTTKYTAGDVAKHASAQDCWTIIHGNVYDITSYIPKHPGGDNIITICGKDGTAAFEGVGHSPKASEILATYQIGVVAQ